MYAMMDHLRYYTLRIQEARMGGQPVDWIAREFCRDYGSELTDHELRELGLLIPFLKWSDFGRVELNSFTRTKGKK